MAESIRSRLTWKSASFFLSPYGSGPLAVADEILTVMF